MPNEIPTFTPKNSTLARKTVHPIALGQAPLLDYDHQLISLATG